MVNTSSNELDNAFLNWIMYLYVKTIYCWDGQGSVPPLFLFSPCFQNEVLEASFTLMSRKGKSFLLVVTYWIHCILSKLYVPNHSHLSGSIFNSLSPQNFPGHSILWKAKNQKPANQLKDLLATLTTTLFESCLSLIPGRGLSPKAIKPYQGSTSDGVFHKVREGTVRHTILVAAGAPSCQCAE